MTEAQKIASDPQHSVWVSASAGSGKTKVLTDRVLRLMVGGVASERILCLTFTKAAAAEMKSRILGQLAKWPLATDAALSVALHQLTGVIPNEVQMVEARQLFAKVLEAPQGLRIMTVHAFCQELLARFPVEASVGSHFTVMEEREQKKLLQELRNQLLTENKKDGEVQEWQGALERLSIEIHSTGVLPFIVQILAKEAMFETFWAVDAGMAKVHARICDYLGIDPNDDAARARKQMVEVISANDKHFYYLVDRLKEGAATDVKTAAKLERWLSLDAEQKLAEFYDYESIFYTPSGTKRKSVLRTKKLKEDTHLSAFLEQEQEQLELYYDRVRAIDIAKSSTDVVLFAKEVIEGYRVLKHQHGVLDYGDLIARAKSLLADGEMSDWVRYKLDGGIDHVLVDEAQDTSADQWAVIQSIAEDFFAGQSAESGSSKSLFVVGDDKQSIYSFQGADPQLFDRMQAYFGQRVLDASHSWQHISLDRSFRSTQAVLQCVDYVFANENLHKSITSQTERIAHAVHRLEDAGHVAVWPLVVPDEAQEAEVWPVIASYQETQKPVHRCAADIAERISGWLQEKRVLPAKGRPIKAGDIMVLVRRRNELVDALLSELKKRQVPVAGMDRLELLSHIAIEDLLALASFVLLPEDDMNLAIVLKTPFLDVDEQTLFELAHDRNEVSLWQCVQYAQRLTQQRRYLEELRSLSQNNAPFDFFSTILDVWGGRQLLMTRMGDAVEDPLDEFLALCLQYEETETPNLQGFLRWLQQGAAVIKRDQEDSGDVVRVLTVHGSKGLQAPVVILPDTTQIPTNTGNQADKVVWDNAAGVPLWRSRADSRDSVTEQLVEQNKVAQLEEYYRLLYVALTRAEDELYITGYSNQPERMVDSCWYNVLCGAMQEHTDQEQAHENVLFSISTPQRVLPAVNDNQEVPPSTEIPIPEWMGDVPQLCIQGHQMSVAPSKLVAEEWQSHRHLEFANYAAKRGDIIHALLEFLPEIPVEQRERVVEHYVQQEGGVLKEEDCEVVKQQVQAILGDVNLVPIFGAGSLAEVPLVGIVDGKQVSGQVDRMLVTENEVWVVDYKTSLNPPKSPATVPDRYYAQMQLYKKLLQPLYPQRQIRTALLWTASAEWMEIS